MKPLFATLLTSLALLGATPAAAAPKTIAPLRGSTAVQAYNGIQTWSDYDVTSRSWHVVVRRDGRISTPTIPTARRAIEVDVGPGPSGTVMLAYTSCTSSCRVVVSGVDGSTPRMVPGSQGAAHPTIWADRVAWVSGKSKVMISDLDGSARKVLGGPPDRKCYYSSLVENARLRCAPPQSPSVDALQLYRGQLALIDTFILNDNVGTVGITTEVRTEAIRGGPQRLIALLGVGEGDESWLGPSWSEGKLFFYEDSMGAGFVVWRFDPARGTYASAHANTYLSGFSVVGGRAWEATSPGARAGSVCVGAEETEPCAVRLSEPLLLKRARAPVHVP